MSRLCRKCGETKPISGFVRNRCRKGGYNTTCKVCISEWRRAHYRKHPEVFKVRAIRYYAKNHAQIKQRLLDRRMAVLGHYSNGTMACSCCGTGEYEFLTIDHITPVGRKGRTALGHDGSGVYQRLVKDGFPAGYRVLCYNCNCARGFHGFCPHEVKSGVEQHAGR